MSVLLQDNFEGPLDTSKWTNFYSSPGEGPETFNGRLRLDTSDWYEGVYTDLLYPGELFVARARMTVPPPGPDGGREFGFQVFTSEPLDPHTGWSIFWSDHPGNQARGKLILRRFNNGAFDSLTLGNETYDTTIDAWWQIRMDAEGFVHWETSPDGVTWRELRVGQYDIPDKIRFDMFAGNWVSSNSNPQVYGYVDEFHAAQGGFRPKVGSVAEELYASMGPLVEEDRDNDYHALILLEGAAGGRLQQVEDLTRDTDKGPGWSSILDVDRCPPEGLPWLGQHVGVPIPEKTAQETTDEYAERMRARIRGKGGFARGTPGAMVRAAVETLTGQKRVVFREREGGAYRLTVYTYASETPSATATEKALRSQKPAGIVLTYATTSGNDFNWLNSNYASFNAVKAGFADFNDITA